MEKRQNEEDDGERKRQHCHSLGLQDEQAMDEDGSSDEEDIDIIDISDFIHDELIDDRSM